MGDFQSSRRRQTQEQLGLTSQREQIEIDNSIRKEGIRKAQKELRRIEIEQSSSYRMAQWVAKYMDKYCLDPILGLIFPGIGDVLTSVCVLPFISVSVFKVRSIPLTLAVIYNVLLDALIGMIPFYIGAVCDFINRAYIRNARLITGFVEDDKEVIREVNRKAGWMALMIGVVGFLIYLMVLFVMKIAEWMGNLWDWIAGLF